LTPRARRRDPRAAALAALALGAAALVLGSCGARPAAAPAGAATYAMRGRVERPADPDRTLWIRHESVPEFRDERGEKVGMESMLMPFTPADDLDLAGLAAGDKIAFTLAVSWTADRRPIQIVAWSRLPAGTQLEFERPPAGASGTPR
jgi:hypothetical protein